MGDAPATFFRCMIRLSLLVIVEFRGATPVDQPACRLCSSPVRTAISSIMPECKLYLSLPLAVGLC